MNRFNTPQSESRHCVPAKVLQFFGTVASDKTLQNSRSVCETCTQLKADRVCGFFPRLRTICIQASPVSRDPVQNLAVHDFTITLDGRSASWQHSLMKTESQIQKQKKIGFKQNMKKFRFYGFGFSVIGFRLWETKDHSGFRVKVLYFRVRA